MESKMKASIPTVIVSVPARKAERNGGIEWLQDLVNGTPSMFGLLQDHGSGFRRKIGGKDDGFPGFDDPSLLESDLGK